MKSIQRFLLLTLIALFIGCGAAPEMPRVNCEIAAGQLLVSPVSGTQCTVLQLMVTYTLRARSGHKAPNPRTEYIILLPTDAKAVIDGREYPIVAPKQNSGVSTRYIYGYPKGLKSGRRETIHKRELDKSSKYEGLSEELDKYWKIFRDPEFEKTLRTYQVGSISIKERYAEEGDEISLQAEIKDGKLVLLAQKPRLKK